MHQRARRTRARGNNFLANFAVFIALSVVVLTGLNKAMAGQSSHKEVPIPQDWLVSLSPIDQGPDQPSLSITAQIPELSIVQQCTLDHVILPIIENPEPILGRGKHMIDENTKQVYLQLLLTESSFEHWYPRGDETDCSFLWAPHDPAEIKTSGVVWNGTQFWGIGQVGEHLCDPLDWRDPWQNTYCSLDYFVWLVREYDGDFTLAIAAYKGAADTLGDGTVVLNPHHPHVAMVFDLLTLSK